MKRIGAIFDEIVSFENLFHAWRKARRGKRNRPDVASFALNLESELLALQRELDSGESCPGEYRQFTIYERKPRTISKAPFRDRVVHHALMNVIEPRIDRQFINDSYACRKGRGVHAAVDRYQTWSRRYTYCLKLDVARYFASIDHEILHQKIERRIKDARVLALIGKIIDTSPREIANEPVWFPGDDLFTPLERRRGLPIGNLTSQFFANLYLDDLDRFVKQELKHRAWLRYVDDLFLLDDDKSRLHECRMAITDCLGQDRLRLRPGIGELSQTARGVDVLGYRVFPHKRRLRAENGYRYRRRLRELSNRYANGDLDFIDARQSIMSWIGHARHADSEGLRRAVLSQVVFQRKSI